MASDAGLDEYNRTRIDEGLDILRECDPDDEQVRPLLIRALINRQVEASKWQEQEANNKEARDLARGFDLIAYSVATGNVADFTARRGDLDTASELFAESLATADEAGKPSRRLDARWQAANFERADNDDPVRAEQLYSEAIEIGRSSGQDVWASLLDAHRSAVRLQLGKTGAFEEFLSAAQECLDVPDFKLHGAQERLLVFRGQFDADQGRHARAAKVVGAIQALRDGGDSEDPYHDRLIEDFTRRATEALGQSKYEEERAVGLHLDRSERLDLISGN